MQRERISNTDNHIMFPIILFAFAIISIAALLSIGYDGKFNLTGDLKTQTASYIIGFIIIVLIKSVDYHIYLDNYMLIYFFSLILILSVYSPVGITLHGSRAWLNLGFTTLQPSEIAKVTFILWLAAYLSTHTSNIHRPSQMFAAAAFSAPIILFTAINDMGSALVFSFVFVCMITIAGADQKIIKKCVVAFLFSMPILYSLLKGYQKERISSFLHPGSVSASSNYQVWNSKVAIGSGGLFGKGYLHGTQKWLRFLPVRESDFIFSVIIEETGFIGGAVLFTLYFLFLNRIAQIGSTASDGFAKLVCAGFIAMFGFQIFENIAMTMGLMPITGITLPFISSGGSSVVSCMLAAGIIENIAIKSGARSFKFKS